MLELDDEVHAEHHIIDYIAAETQSVEISRKHAERLETLGDRPVDRVLQVVHCVICWGLLTVAK